jgi:hypothetical protein
MCSTRVASHMAPTGIVRRGHPGGSEDEAQAVRTGSLALSPTRQWLSDRSDLCMDSGPPFATRGDCCRRRPTRRLCWRPTRGWTRHSIGTPGDNGKGGEGYPLPLAVTTTVPSAEASSARITTAQPYSPMPPELYEPGETRPRPPQWPYTALCRSASAHQGEGTAAWSSSRPSPSFWVSNDKAARYWRSRIAISVLPGDSCPPRSCTKAATGCRNRENQ